MLKSRPQKSKQKSKSNYDLLTEAFRGCLVFKIGRDLFTIVSDESVMIAKIIKVKERTQMNWQYFTDEKLKSIFGRFNSDWIVKKVAFRIGDELHWFTYE